MAALQAGTPIFSELHVVLYDMFRIAQRTVDYATKAYESQRLEYTRYVRHERHRFDYLWQQVLLAFADVVERKQLCEGQHWFKETACTISSGLARICNHADNISQFTVNVLTGVAYKRSQSNITTSKVLNSVMRLCAVALLNDAHVYARIALREIHRWGHEDAIANQSKAELVAHADAWEHHIARSLRAILGELWVITVAILRYNCEDQEKKRLSIAERQLRRTWIVIDGSLRAKWDLYES